MSAINVIIPVYNAEKYLHTMLDSLLVQTFQDFSLYIVNDCSTDKTEDVILEYKEKFKDKLDYIKNSTNMRQGESRNIGFRQSMDNYAKYTVFLDADDWVENDFFESLYKKAELENADIAICGIERYEDNTNKVICMEAVYGKTVELDKRINMYELAYINPAPYNKIYRTESIKNHSFMPLERSEDTCFFFEILQDVNTIVFTNKVGYHYRLREDSLTGTIKESTIKSMMDGFSKLYSELKAKKSDYLGELETQVFIRVACGGVCRVCFDDMTKRKEIVYDTKRYMDELMPNWRKNDYLRLMRKSVNIKAVMLRICSFMYRYNMFDLVVVVYYLMLKVLKRDIRM